MVDCLQERTADQMTSLPIAVCMISGAEAHRIGRALESVAGWTSEIIVVLNEEVRDGTEEIAKKYGAMIFREHWKGFIAQKNSAAQKVSQPWLLGLDADEAVSPELRADIQKVLAGPAESPSFAAFRFPRLAWYSGRWIRHGDWYPDFQVRLWRRGSAEWGGVDPHAKLLVRGNVSRLNGNLLHYTSETLDQLVAKSLSYADEFVRQYPGNGRSVHCVDLLTRPAWRFVRGYFIRRGFLDGWQGASVAWMGAFYTFLRYAKALESRREAPRS
jgi:glycosyltransferase involved in cell wall biosynthesis